MGPDPVQSGVDTCGTRFGRAHPPSESCAYIVIAMKARHPKRGDVHLIGLDPTRGREIKKTRRCVISSPDQLNAHLQTVIVAPLTSSGKAYTF